MKKAAILGGLVFFVHGLLFQCFFWGQDKYISDNNGDSDHGIDMFIAIFYTILFFSGIIITIVLEKNKKCKYKYLIFFLVFGNCLLQFYWQSFHQYDLFSSPERFSNFSIILILGYFLFELGFTYYIVDRLYNKSQNT